MSRWRPKEWTRPRSRAWRNAHDGSWSGAIRIREIADILKRLYSSDARPEEIKPAWAQVSLKFGWMTRGAFAAVPRIKTGRMLTRLVLSGGWPW